MRSIVIVATSVLLSAALGVVNYLVGAELAFSVFYLLPISLATWYVNRRGGLVVALASALNWFLVDHLSGTVYSRDFVPYWNSGVRFVFFVIFVTLLGEIRGQLDLARELALIDPVTGAANNRKFFVLAEQALARAFRSNAPLTIAYIDLDDFKAVNDRYGHQAGDEVLSLVVDVIKREVRQSDLVARLGGDEFAVLLSETGQEESDVVIRRVRWAIESDLAARGREVTISVGVVTFVRPPASTKEMIAAADRLMYRVKSEGKGYIAHEVMP